MEFSISDMIEFQDNRCQQLHMQSKMLTIHARLAENYVKINTGQVIHVRVQKVCGCWKVEKSLGESFLCKGAVLFPNLKHSGRGRRFNVEDVTYAPGWGSQCINPRQTPGKKTLMKELEHSNRWLNDMTTSGLWCVTSVHTGKGCLQDSC